MNKLGKTSIGVVILVIGVLAFLAIQFDLIDLDLDFGGEEESEVSACPASGMTEVTVNAHEALASTSTDATVDIYVFDGSKLVKTDTTSSGTASFDVECGVDKTYKAIALNETTNTGYYPLEFTIKADKPTDTHNLKFYEYGQINLVSVASSLDPTGGSNIAAGAGKVCGYTVTFTENESVSAFNKPLIICDVNTTSVVDLTMSGVSEANDKEPNRLSAASGYQFYTFEYDELVKSTDSAIALDGKIEFSESNAPQEGDDLTCRIVDQATFSKADYQSLSMSEGFVESAENTETISDIGAPDSPTASLTFNATATNYC